MLTALWAIMLLCLFGAISAFTLAWCIWDDQRREGRMAAEIVREGNARITLYRATEGAKRPRSDETM